jgi:hypothetical protein
MQIYYLVFIKPHRLEVKYFYNGGHSGNLPNNVRKIISDSQ